MKKLSRSLFNQVIGNSKARKALELYLYVKNKYASSTIPNFTYKGLSKETGLCYTSVKKRISTLKELDLIEFVGKNKQHLLFKNARAKKSNVNVGVLNKTDIQSISDGLFALFLVEIQLRKDYIKQLLLKKETAQKRDNIKAVNKEIRERGLIGKKFVDNGISYKYIAKRLKIGFNRVSALIKNAVKLGMLSVEKHIELIFDAKDSGKSGHFAFQYVVDKRNRFATNRGIYEVKANSYILNKDMDW